MQILLEIVFLMLAMGVTLMVSQWSSPIGYVGLVLFVIGILALVLIGVWWWYFSNRRWKFITSEFPRDL